MTGIKKFTVEEAVKYVQSKHGHDVEPGTSSKVEQFLMKFPHNPESYKWNRDAQCTEITVADYSKKFTITVRVGDQNGKLYCRVIDTDIIQNPNAPKDNLEAMELIKNYHEVKDAYDYDPYYEYSDDPSVGRWARNLNQEARATKNDIIRKLIAK